jgi:formate hydrogenlyase subunit 4
VSAALPIPVIQLLQVLTVALGAPGVTGVIAKVEARLQGRRGPRLRQPYYDLAKLFRKEALAPEGASWFFLAAPLIAVTCYLTIPLLIPVLTSYPLPLGYMGDILGGGFLLSLASFVVATAALETGSPYAQLGSSRAKTFSAITEPVVLFVVFTVALLTGTAAAARADTRRGRKAPQGRHRRRRRADGHLLVPGPAARHRAADPGAGSPARRARPDREGVRVC